MIRRKIIEEFIGEVWRFEFGQDFVGKYRLWFGMF